MRRIVTIDIISAALTLLLVYAAMSKLLEYPLFAAQLHTHPYLKHFAGLLAWALPLMELVVAAMLVMPRTRLVGFYCSAALLLVFTVYLALMLLSGRNLPCSCGGIVSSLSWRQHIVFNLIFLGIVITGIILSKKENKQASSLPEYA